VRLGENNTVGVEKEKSKGKRKQVPGKMIKTP
jgi:hypothetical protein